MSALIHKLQEAQKYAITNRPSVGGFPFFAEVLRQTGVLVNRWSLPSCQSIYVMKDGSVVQQGAPLFSGTNSVPLFDSSATIKAIRADQNGLTTFSEFLEAIWKAGVVSYDVDFVERKVTYFGVLGESYVEDYPYVDIQK